MTSILNNPVPAMESASLRSRFASAMVWSVLAAVASRVLGLAATMIAAHLLGKARFGQFGAVLNISNIVGSLAAAGLGVTATRYVADLRVREPERAGRIVALAWLTAVVSGLVLAVLSVATAGWMARTVLHAGSLAGPLRLASVLVLLNGMLAFQNGALAGLEAFRKLARINLISGACSLPLIGIGTWRFGLYGAVIGTILWQMATWLCSERLLRMECRRAGLTMRVAGLRAERHIFFNFSLPALLGSFSTLPVLWFCNVLIVRSRNGFDQMALYTAADRLRIAVLFLPTAIFQAALPVLSNTRLTDRAAYRKVSRDNLLVNAILVCIPAGLILVLSHRIMAAYGNGFEDGTSVLVLFVLSTIPSALNTLLGYPLLTQGRMWARFAYDLLLSGALLGLAIHLIPRYGARGFAVANLGAFTAVCLALLVDSHVHKETVSFKPDLTTT